LFDRLRQAFSAVTTAVRERRLSGAELSDVTFNFQLSLIESDVAQSVAEKLTQEVEKSLTGAKVDRSEDASEVVGERLHTVLESAFARTGTVDILENIREKNRAGEPYVILFLGINGTGKTTTIA
jgi:fused signal recognition particle receptor